MRKNRKVGFFSKYFSKKKNIDFVNPDKNFSDNFNDIKYFNRVDDFYTR